MHGPDLLLSYTTFCLIMATTPGPNNMMVLASGVRFGTRRTLPLALGIAVGMAVLFGATGSGLGAAFDALPALGTGLRLLSAAFLFWLAWKIATAGPLRRDQDELKVLGFPTGVAFQWINPKAWAAAMTAASTYLPDGAGATTIAAGAAIIALAALFATTTWLTFGLLISRFLHEPGRARAFNIVMAVLLLASTLPILFGRLAE
ncbi:LysE family translocator [Oricola sp.]|uniref:LysE family translocator n=1 Tax=Oricola sp. TaxID=1979950 RepID=UPI0025CE052A|nr:LysE family translocator [Oricola sp.]MCI5078406.1 LysE family translocator [Oricola sp.]